MGARGKGRRHAPRSKGLFDEWNSRLIQSFAEWDLLDAFQKRVMLRRMGIPRASTSIGTFRPRQIRVGDAGWKTCLSRTNCGLPPHRPPTIRSKAVWTTWSLNRRAQLRQAMERKYRELGFKSGDARRMVKTADVADPSRVVERSRAA